MQVEPSTRFANRALDSGERFLRRSKKRSPLLFPEVPLSLAITVFLTIFTVRIFLQNTPVFPQGC